MSSLFKAFNQTPLDDYGNVLAWFEILAFSSKLSLGPILGHSESSLKIPGEMSISRDLISTWEHWKVCYTSMKSEEQQFFGICDVIGQGKKVNDRRNLNSSYDPFLYSC